jgi:hypothetical protein
LIEVALARTPPKRPVEGLPPKRFDIRLSMTGGFMKQRLPIQAIGKAPSVMIR